MRLADLGTPVYCTTADRENRGGTNDVGFKDGKDIARSPFANR